MFNVSISGYKASNAWVICDEFERLFKQTCHGQISGNTQHLHGLTVEICA
jgi:hypothetical protein